MWCRNVFQFVFPLGGTLVCITSPRCVITDRDYGHTSEENVVEPVKIYKNMTYGRRVLAEAPLHRVCEVDWQDYLCLGYPNWP